MMLSRCGMFAFGGARVGLPTVAVLCLVSCVLAASTQKAARQSAAGHESFDDFYERGQRANASLKTLTAHFVETTTSSLLTTPLVARGRLAVERPSRVVVHYEAPEAHLVLIDGNRMTVA